MFIHTIYDNNFMGILMYKYFALHFSNWLWCFKHFFPFMKIKQFPKTEAVKKIKQSIKNKSAIYVLPSMSIIDTIVLNKALELNGLEPVYRDATQKFKNRALLALNTKRFFPFKFSLYNKFIRDICDIIRNDSRYKDKNLIFIPISIFWSRSREIHSMKFLTKSFIVDLSTASFLKKIFFLLLHRGEVNVVFGNPISPPSVDYSFQKKENPSHDKTKRHISVRETALQLRRKISIEFNKERTIFTGPTVYSQDRVFKWIISSPESKKIIDSSKSPNKTISRMFKYFNEIASDYSYMVIRIIVSMLDYVWNKLFNGVRIRNFDEVAKIARDGHVIWVPSHKSHLDYILLTYVLYKKGLHIPHVAAGINLSFWPFGYFIKKSGSFFIRRSFSGNKLYAHVFSEYINFLLKNSDSIEFFIEGGRSRIGKTLKPKFGFLGICADSILKRKSYNTYFVPVSFSYEKLIEVNSYADELMERKKKKETFFQLLLSLPKILINYGTVDVAFGKPLRFGDYLEKFSKEQKLVHMDEIQDKAEVKKSLISGLSYKIIHEINKSTTPSNTALIAACVLAFKENSIKLSNIAYYLNLIFYIFDELNDKLNWSIHINVTKGKNADESLTSKESIEKGKYISNEDSPFYKIIEDSKKSKFVQTKKIQGKTYLIRNENLSAHMSWYRGTIFHLLALPGIVSSLLIQIKKVSIKKSSVIEMFSEVRKVWSEEVFWSCDDTDEAFVFVALKALSHFGLIQIKDDNTIALSTEEESIDSLMFLSRLIWQEKEMYKDILLTCEFITNKKSYFYKNDVILFLCGKSNDKESFSFLNKRTTYSKFLINRAFDCLLKGNVFSESEKGYKFKTKSSHSLHKFFLQDI